MSYDLDPLDDNFADEAAKNARAGGKFQPKPKFRPQKMNAARTSVASSQAVQTIDAAASESSEPNETAKLSEQCSNAVPNDNADGHAFMEKPVGENADIFIGLEALGDFLPQTTTDKESSDPSSAAVALNVPNSENIGGRHGTPVLSSVEDSAHTCKVADVPTDPGLSAEVDHVTAGEPIVSSADIHDDKHDRELGREEMDVMDSINMTDSTAKSGQRRGKFQPKPKLKPQMQKQICEASDSYSLDSRSVPPEIDDTEKDLVPTFQQDDVLDLSPLGLTHASPAEATSELPLNEESINLMEVSQLDSTIHLEDLPEIPAKLASRRAKTGSNKTPAASDPSSQQPKASISSHENGIGRSLRPRKGKTNFCELVDEDTDEALATGEISEECPPDSAIEEDNINNEEIQVESESQKKNLKRKSKKTDDGKEKPATKKSKKAKEASDQEGAKHKKFSHSTRRRKVDKALLEIPQEEFDPQKVPLRDLILLAEHRERRGEVAEGAPATNQSDENFTSEQDGEDNDGERPMVDTTVNFNYHSYMERKVSKRWSKQETELFYEAVRQFGTDLSMIKLRFPGRDRNQLKLKYKKEERQHPLRLREALTNRSKDLSHYQEVIEQLRQKSAEENQNADKDDLMDLEGNEGTGEGVSNADDDEAKDEHIEEEQNEKVANDFTEVHSPVKSDDDEDDFLLWSQYKSDI